MKKKDIRNGTRKKHKVPSLLPNQTLISQFFSKSPNVDHVSTIEDNEDEDIVLHRQSKHRVEVDDEEDDDEVALMAADKFVEDEDIKVHNHENKRCLEDDIVDVSDEVTIIATAKKYKHEDTAFYKLINTFLNESANKFVPIPMCIRNRAI